MDFKFFRNIFKQIERSQFYFKNVKSVMKRNSSILAEKQKK